MTNLAVYWASSHLARIMFEINFPGEILGLDNIPRRGAFIVAINHASMLDPPLLGALMPRQVRAFARRTLWQGPVFSWWLDAVGVIPVDRDGGSDVTAIRRVLATLKEGMGVVLFPEGTRSRTGELQPAKAGVGLMACRTGVPVVPARIFGSFEAMGRGGPMRLGTPISIIFGPPLRAADYDDGSPPKDRYQHASDRIMAAIAALQLPRPVVI
jgi:1-acyl-sn-glycerol-3-phosphate acyltransferase